MKKERVRSKHGFKGFGVFLLGWFIGLISAIGILVGLGFWAYSSLSIRKIEKWTRNEITDNEVEMSTESFEELFQMVKEGNKTEADEEQESETELEESLKDMEGVEESEIRGNYSKASADKLWKDIK